MDVNELLDLLKEGESEKVEFKASLPKDINKTIVAFANAYGGTILIGVDNKGKIVGTDIRTVKDRIANSVQSIVPGPEITISTVKVNKLNVLVVGVKKSEELCSVGGVAHIRIGAGTRPLSIKEVLMLASELGTIEWDRSPGASLEEMKESYLEHFFQTREEIRGKKVPKRERKRFLRSIGATRKDKLTNAGILFFTDPQDHIPHARIRLVKSENNEPVWSREFEGPLWKVIEEAIVATENETRQREIIVGSTRRSIGAFPHRVLREAIINAVSHRNYLTNADTRIFLRSDGITIRNPGGLLPGVELDDPEHIPRNPSICNLLYEMGLIERYGSGILMMKEEVEKVKSLTLHFMNKPNRFDVTLKRNVDLNLEKIDRDLLEHLSTPKRSGYLIRVVNVSKPTIINHLKKLIALGLVKKEGKGPSTRYLLK